LGVWVAGQSRRRRAGSWGGAWSSNLENSISGKGEALLTPLRVSWGKAAVRRESSEKKS